MEISEHSFITIIILSIFFLSTKCQVNSHNFKTFDSVQFHFIRRNSFRFCKQNSQPMSVLILYLSDNSTSLYNISVKIFHFKIPFRFTPLVFFCNILALVIKLFAPGKTDFHLNKAVLKIHFKGNQSQALFL